MIFHDCEKFVFSRGEIDSRLLTTSSFDGRFYTMSFQFCCNFMKFPKKLSMGEKSIKLWQKMIIDYG